MTSETFLITHLARILSTNKIHHKFGLKILEDMDYIIYQENCIKKYINLSFVEGSDIYRETVLSFTMTLHDWKLNLQDVIDYCQKYQINLPNKLIIPKLFSFGFISFQLYYHLFNTTIKTPYDQSINDIHTTLHEIIQNLYILNSQNKVTGLRDINSFWNNLKILTDQIDLLFYTLQQKIRYIFL